MLFRSLVFKQGTHVSLPTRMAAALSAETPPRPAGPAQEIPIVEPGQNRQLASWRFFTHAQNPGGPPQLLKLDGYDQTGWPDGSGGSIVEITPQVK